MAHDHQKTDQKNQEQAEQVQQESAANNQELENCQEQLGQAQERLSYLQADFENFRRNTTKERAAWARAAQAEVFKDLLSIIDDFERAITDLQNATDLQECEIARFQGFDLIHKAFTKILQSHQVQEVAVYGPFDPQKHEALVQVESADKESGQIVEVLQKGYVHKEVVLRPAKVSVAK